MTNFKKVFANKKISFSQWCISGILGDKCNCSRCRKNRGQEITPESEELSKLQSIIYRDTGGLKDSIWAGIYPEIEKGNTKPMDLAKKAYKKVVEHFETGLF